jgi:hypothetical protein
MAWWVILTQNKGLSLKTLLNIIENIDLILPDDQLLELVKLLKDREFNQPTTLDINSLKISPVKANQLNILLKGITNEADLKAITLGLLQCQNREKSPSIELCWTGPSNNSHLRMTGPALAELILNATRSIIIVGYSINTNTGQILDYLKQKSDSGVKLIFMVDRLEEKHDFFQWATSLTMPPELYNRPQDDSDTKSALHIKCVVIDEKAAMFGSANLTYHGLKGNYELGLIVRDKKIVQDITKMLNDLKSRLVNVQL